MYFMMDDFYSEFTTTNEILKRKIKSAAGKCTMLMLILGISAQGLAILSSIILGGYSILTKNHEYIRNIEFANIVLGIIPCILADILVIIIGLKVTRLNFRRDIFKKVKYSKKIIPLGVMSVGGILLISTTIYIIYSTIIQVVGLTIPAPDFTFPSSKSMQAIYILYICILGPILEEIIFRGIVLNTIKKYGAFTAIIFTSIIFSMFHLNLVQFMTPLLLGILLAFVTIKTESTVPAIIIHIFNNTIATLITFLSEYSQVLSTIISTCIIFLGIFALIIFINKYKNDFKKLMIEDKKIFSFGKKIKYCFVNTWSIGYIIFYIAFIFGNFIFMNI